MLGHQKKNILRNRLPIEDHHFIREVIILRVQAPEFRESDPLVCVVGCIFEGCKRNGRTRRSTAVVGIPATSYVRGSAYCGGTKSDITRPIGTRRPVTMRLRVCKTLAGGGALLLLVKLIRPGDWCHSEGDTQGVGQIRMRRRVGRYGRRGYMRSRVPHHHIRLTQDRRKLSRGSPCATRVQRRR